jgi:hypothetical protein
MRFGSVFYFFLICTGLWADTFDSLIADQIAIERVYHEYRLGQSTPFEESMPEALAEAKISLLLLKEVLLEDVYGISITQEMLETEVQRIHRTTRAPDILAQIKAALEEDAARFARSMARPIIVERELRRCFVSDASLHTSQRTEAEQCRADLLARVPVSGMQEMVWQLTSREAGESPVGSAQIGTQPNLATEVRARSTLYSVEATAQIAQKLPTSTGYDAKHYFEDLNPELAKLLKAQLHTAGDVSAVIETDTTFLIFQAKEINETTMEVASKRIPKRSYDEWLQTQTMEEVEL